MNRRFDGRQRVVQKARHFIKIDENYPGCSISGSSSRSQAPVESESLPKSLPDASSGGLSEKLDKFQESQEAGTGGCGQPAGKEEDSETSDEIEPLLVPKSARSISGRRHHRLRIWVYHYLTTLCKFLKFLMERTLHLDEDVEVNDAHVVYPNDYFVLEVQHHHGSQLVAAEMDRWLSSSRFGSNRQPIILI